MFHRVARQVARSVAGGNRYEEVRDVVMSFLDDRDEIPDDSKKRSSLGPSVSGLMTPRRAGLYRRIL